MQAVTTLCMVRPSRFQTGHLRLFASAAADAAATAASCCAGRFQHCSPCIAGACDPNYPGGWHGQVLSDGSYGYCDALFFGACCTTARCG